MLTALALAGLTAGCGRESHPPEGWIPLVDPDLRPDILVEARELSSPPSLDGNRFLLGWAGWQRRGELELWSEPSLRRSGVARLEVTTLVSRPRTLVLELDTRRRLDRAWRAATGPTPIAVRVAGCYPADGSDCQLEATLPTNGQVELELPSMPLGRAAVDLVLPDGLGLAVRQAGVRQVLPPGAVELASATDGNESDVAIDGWAGVDFVRRVEGPATLHGTFVPPDLAGPDERHTLWVELADQAPRRVFSWSQDHLGDRWRGERRLAVPIPGVGSRLVRVRLLAEGDGASAHWLGLGLADPASYDEQQIVATSAADEPPRPHRVILYMLDALRADRVTAELMPNLLRLAAEGASFANHQSVAPNTRPSIHALLGGRTPMSPRGLNQLAERPLPEAIRAAGYRTVLFSDNGNVSPGWGMDRGFDEVYMGWAPEAVQPLTPHNNSAERMQRAALAWLDQLPAEQPAFVYLHVLNPHNPYLPPRHLLRDPKPPAVSGSTEFLLRVQNRRRKLRPAERRGLAELYDASIRYADRQLAAFARELATRYPDGEVLLVVTADHGEELFDHGGVLHGYTLYEEQLAVPLVFWWPGQLASRVIDSPSDHLDLHETLLALTGAAPTERAGELGRGEPLTQELLGSPAPPDDEVRLAAAGSLAGGIFSARWRDHKLIWAPRRGGDWGMGYKLGRQREPELVFDLATDPGEQENLAGEETLEVAWLRSHLRAWVDRELQAERGAPEEELTVDETTRAQLRALGYVD